MYRIIFKHASYVLQIPGAETEGPWVGRVLEARPWAGQVAEDR